MANAGVSSIKPADWWDGSSNYVKSGTFDAANYLKTPTQGTYSVSYNGLVTCIAYPGLSTDDLLRLNE